MFEIIGAILTITIFILAFTIIHMFVYYSMTKDLTDEKREKYDNELAKRISESEFYNRHNI